MRCQLLVPVPDSPVHAGLACALGRSSAYELNKLIAIVLDGHSRHQTLGSMDCGDQPFLEELLLRAGGAVDPAWALLCRSGHYFASSNPCGLAQLLSWP